MMKLHLMLLAVVLLCGAGGCGQTGDLYLPDSTSPPAQQPLSPSE